MGARHLSTRGHGSPIAGASTPQALRLLQRSGGLPVLVTIPLSHFCEKARWALDYLKVPFVESAHAPGLHARIVRRLGGRHSTPILVTDQGALFPSSQILHWADSVAQPPRRLYPSGERHSAEVKFLEHRLDDVLGPHARRLAYYDLLPYASIVGPLMTHAVPIGERLLCRSTYPILRALMRRGMEIDAAGAAASKVAVAEVFGEIEQRLADGRPYLLGDRFSAIDITFAALAAPLVWPTEYSVPLPALERLPSRAADNVRGWRNTIAGAFRLRMFRDHRQ